METEHTTEAVLQFLVVTFSYHPERLEKAMEPTRPSMVVVFMYLEEMSPWMRREALHIMRPGSMGEVFL